MTQIINLFAGPGAGKSTTAARLFALMKEAGLNVELVTEYAKDLTWDKSWEVLNDQLLVTAEQNHRIERLVGTVDWIITDSPILLGLAYLKEPWPGFGKLVIDLWQSRYNHAVILHRTKPYMPIGRREDEESAKVLDDVTHTLARYYTPSNRLWEIDGSHDGTAELLEKLVRRAS